MRVPIHYTQIFMEIPTIVLKIESLTVVEELNEHGYAKVLFLTDDKDKCKIIDEITSETEVKIVFKTEEQPQVIFIGHVTKVLVKSIKDTYNIVLDLKSKSFLTDVKKIRRSFQNKDNTYENLFKQVIAEYPAKIFDTASKGAVQEDSIIQYDETDWMFLKRLASRLKAKLVTNVREQNILITVGKQIGESTIQKTYGYILENEAKEFLESHLNFGDWNQEQKIHYDMQSQNPYYLYDKLQYNELIFTIIKKITKLEQGIINFTYTLLKESGVRQDLILNEKILGVSIEGKVLDVREDRLKLHLVIDKTQSVEEAFWYKIETYYTADGSTGLYTMPEKGDTVELYFPKTTLEDGHVRTSKRQDGNENSKTQKPDIKNYRTPYKRELMIAPKEIQVTTKNGMILVNLDQDLGIEITSSHNVDIHTDDFAKIKGKKVAFRAGDEVKFSTKHSGIVVEKEVHFKADGTVSGV